jgi:hypothetical protein
VEYIFLAIVVKLLVTTITENSMKSLLYKKQRTAKKLGDRLRFTQIAILSKTRAKESRKSVL